MTTRSLEIPPGECWGQGRMIGAFRLEVNSYRRLFSRKEKTGFESPETGRLAPLSGRQIVSET